VKINFNIVKGQTQYNLTGGNSSFEPTVYRQALIRNPTSPISTSTGTWVESSRFQYYNPVAMIDETDGINKDDYTRLSSTLTIRPIKDIEVNAMFSNRNDNSINDYYETQENYSTTNGGKNGVASKSSSSNFSNDMDLTAKYSKTIDKHNFSAMIGYSYEYTESESFYASNYNFPSDSYTYNNIGTGYALQDGKAGMGSGKSSSTLIGGFSRISYGYDNRYNLLASIRREGSSKFGNNYKWGSFPSVSAGWTISNEEFMKPVTFVDNLKLRTGYGITGVIPSAPYASQTLLVYDSNGYFDNNGTWIKGIIPYSNPNPNLRWETSGELNIGLDFAVLKSRISGSVDVYNKRTKDMLWNYNVPVPPYLFPTVLANVGEMSNKGIEVVLTAIPLKNKDFEWTSTITLSHNENKLISLSNDFYKIDNNYMNMGDTGDPISFATHRLEVGQSIGNFWGLKSVGVTHKGDEFGTDGSAAKPEGQWIIETSKGVRKVLTPDMYGDENKQYLGNGIPQVNAGWTNTIRFKNFDLSMVMNGAFGFQILNSQRMFYENPNINYNMLKSAFNKVYGQAVLNYPQTFVSYYIENGDYVKIDNITLGYTLDVKKINFLKSLRIYASAQNLACFTKYKGLDPEIPDSGTLTPGVDSRDKFPSTRTFTFGLNVTF
jgi:TonB-linked SusC/RagA family outer membrane protein